MDREEELRGDPFSYSSYTNFNYYGSSHLQQFPYFDYSATGSGAPQSEATDLGITVSDASNGSDNEDCVEVQVSLHGNLCVPHDQSHGCRHD